MTQTRATAVHEPARTTRPNPAPKPAAPGALARARREADQLRAVLRDLQADVARLRTEGASVIRLDHVEAIVGPDHARAAARLQRHRRAIETGAEHVAVSR